MHVADTITIFLKLCGDKNCFDLFDSGNKKTVGKIVRNQQTNKTEKVSKLVFYTQSPSVVIIISGRKK